MGKVVKLETNAYLTQHSYAKPADLQKNEGIEHMHFTTHDMVSAGWTIVGKATIEVELVDQKTMVDNKVQALRQEAASIRAEATAKCTAIEGKIQQLLCLEMSPVEVETDDGIPF